MIKNNENIINSIQLGKTIQKFIKVIDGLFIEPKKEEYYELLRAFKHCKRVIKDINYIKKVKRRSIREWLWTWVLFFYAKPESAFFALKDSKRDSKFYVNEYWILKNDIKEVEECIDQLDETLDQFEIFSLRMKEVDKKFETIAKEIGEYDKKK